MKKWKRIAESVKTRTANQVKRHARQMMEGNMKVTSTTVKAREDPSEICHMNRGCWTVEEHQRFLDAVREHGMNKWTRIAESVKTRSVKQVKWHAQKIMEGNLKLKSTTVKTSEDEENNDVATDSPSNCAVTTKASVSQQSQNKEELRSSDSGHPNHYRTHLRRYKVSKQSQKEEELRYSNGRQQIDEKITHTGRWTASTLSQQGSTLNLYCSLNQKR